MRRSLARNRVPPQCGHETGPLYRADIVTIPAFSSMPVIWYPGRPKIASALIKTSPLKNVLSVQPQGLPPLTI
jgi:hypothetical protein